MPRYAQLVMGPAGSGKSTYCATMVQHCEALNRSVQVVNLDPAAEHFNYSVMADIRELIEVDDVMEDSTLQFGPNGGLVFCMEYFANNFDWLENCLGHVEDDYILFDCPGQIELYTHLPVMKQLVQQLEQWEFRVCGVFLVDSQFMVESFKFISGILAALSAMISLEIPQVNIMTKMDLLSKKAKKEIEKFLDPDMYSLLDDSTSDLRSKKFKKLTNAICGLIDDYSMVRFLPYDQSDEESMNIVLQHIDFAIQYGEDLEFKEPKFISGILAALSAMISLEIPQVNIMTKMDLLSKKAKKEIEKFLDPDMYSLLDDSTSDLRSKKFKKLTNAICGLIDDYSMVRFLPYDQSDEESMNIVLQHIDFAIQYGEDLEFKEPKEHEDESSSMFDEYFQEHQNE
ncbi:PREDICTED: GPN-loop GTPase 3 isoform X1 [Bison bison bison]|uniref:GPN-loop GTPase 3 n=3 Tax=Bison bison bison TaxID=43346 RepID=A0A6P3IN31_BISBB|nr:PREDICTED: GPN-loop GTPase 3 isoform X1 [Bison bison bison]